MRYRARDSRTARIGSGLSQQDFVIFWKRYQVTAVKIGERLYGLAGLKIETV